MVVLSIEEAIERGYGYVCKCGYFTEKLPRDESGRVKCPCCKTTARAHFKKLAARKQR